MSTPSPTRDARLTVSEMSVYLGDGSEGGEVCAVSDVSFTLQRGEVVGLVGESGSGKSMTSLAIMGLLPRGGRVMGSVKLGDIELTGLKRRELRQLRGEKLSMIFQEPMTALDPLFRVGDQITETIRAHDKVTRRAAEVRAIEMLKQVGIPDSERRASAYPHEFSGGMRQRVMIAMALVCGPEVLIADEPTTALDVTIQAQILELLKTLTRERDTSVLLVSHDLGIVAETCHRTLTMYAGQLVEYGETDDVMTRPQHPYTSGLIRAIPHRSDSRGSLYCIRGGVPPLHQMPEGCRFEDRCEFAQERCAAPQGLYATDRGQVRCIRHDELRLPGAVSAEESLAGSLGVAEGQEPGGVA